MRNIKLTIEYDGTEYLGWQRQPQGPTIQEQIENALQNITGEQIVLQGSGRTDSGVHAKAQVANFKTECEIKPNEFQMGLNSILPHDITIMNAEEVDIEFNSQFSAKSKTYTYMIYNNRYPSALLRKRAWFVPYSLNSEEMRKASKHLIGEHDFKAFAQAGAEVKTTIRTVLDVSIQSQEDSILLFNIEATGFLKRMVRLIIGTLVQVGKGRISHQEFCDILDSGVKTKFVFAAPPQGLYLKEVKY